MAQAAAVSPGPLLDTAHDPTVCDPVDLARLQAHYGVNLEDFDPQMLRHLVDRSRHAGNEAFKDKSYKGEEARAGGWVSGSRGGSPAEAALLRGPRYTLFKRDSKVA
jgi:hypothetical protein